MKKHVPLIIKKTDFQLMTDMIKATINGIVSMLKPAAVSCTEIAFPQSSRSKTAVISGIPQGIYIPEASPKKKEKPAKSMYDDANLKRIKVTVMP